ncbi:hypothetical protein B0H19DRAFT_1147150 [Mycena capillaripes]|nr:hypothetical protein B0H19DRAFT_1147150 [Mycena capillaripes]
MCCTRPTTRPKIAWEPSNLMSTLRCAPRPKYSSHVVGSLMIKGGVIFDLAPPRAMSNAADARSLRASEISSSFLIWRIQLPIRAKCASPSHGAPGRQWELETLRGRRIVEEISSAEHDNPSLLGRASAQIVPFIIPVESWTPKARQVRLLHPRGSWMGMGPRNRIHAAPAMLLSTVSDSLSVPAKIEMHFPERPSAIITPTVP